MGFFRSSDEINRVLTGGLLPENNTKELFLARNTGESSKVSKIQGHDKGKATVYGFSHFHMQFSKEEKLLLRSVVMP